MPPYVFTWPFCGPATLLCGLPQGGAPSLSPLCAALGVRRLFLRTECPIARIA